MSQCPERARLLPRHAPKPTRSQVQPHRRQAWAQRSPQEILSHYAPGHTDPLRVLEVLIELFNGQHTALAKTVSHKTRHERAQFLRRFFRDLHVRAGFKTVPDPRNLGQKHVQAMVDVWRRDQLASATIQTYFSFLRGLASWTAKPGFIRQPQHYGLTPDEYQRHEIATHDHSWRAHAVRAAEVIDEVERFDPHVAASLRLMQALALRRKESVMFRPHAHVQPFARTGLPEAAREADLYAWVKGKGGRVRWVALASQQQKDAVARAQSLVTSTDGHMGNPHHPLKRNLRRMDYVMHKFGLTRHDRGVTAHGLRHERLNDLYEEITGVASPVRGGTAPNRSDDRTARQAVAQLAGHGRLRAASAYIGSSTARTPVRSADDDAAAYPPPTAP